MGFTLRGIILFVSLLVANGFSISEMFFPSYSPTGTRMTGVDDVNTFVPPTKVLGADDMKDDIKYRNDLADYLKAIPNEVKFDKPYVGAVDQVNSVLLNNDVGLSRHMYDSIKHNLDEVSAGRMSSSAASLEESHGFKEEASFHLSDPEGNKGYGVLAGIGYGMNKWIAPAAYTPWEANANDDLNNSWRQAAQMEGWWVRR